MTSSSRNVSAPQISTSHVNLSPHFKCPIIFIVRRCADVPPVWNFSTGSHRQMVGILCEQQHRAAEDIPEPFGGSLEGGIHRCLWTILLRISLSTYIHIEGYNICKFLNREIFLRKQSERQEKKDNRKLIQEGFIDDTVYDRDNIDMCDLMIPLCFLSSNRPLISLHGTGSLTRFPIPSPKPGL